VSQHTKTTCPLTRHPNSLANALFQEQLGDRRLKRLYPGDLATNG